MEFKAEVLKNLDTNMKANQDTNKAQAMDNLENISLTATRKDIFDVSQIDPTALANESASESWNASAPWMKYAIYGVGAWLVWKYVFKK